MLQMALRSQFLIQRSQPSSFRIRSISVVSSALPTMHPAFRVYQKTIFISYFFDFHNFQKCKIMCEIHRQSSRKPSGTRSSPSQQSLKCYEKSFRQSKFEATRCFRVDPTLWRMKAPIFPIVFGKSFKMD